MKVLVVGSGGREHALVWKLAKSPLVKAVLCAPGNPGIAAHARCVDIAATDVVGLVALARREHVALTVVGPEAPLAAGLVDAFQRAGLKIFGPTQRAAQLESSKAFAKTFMQRYGIPTAHYGVFTDAGAAREFAAREPLPVVIKADGLAAGKGVVIAHTRDEADRAIAAWLPGKDAAHRIVIEQFLPGEELSCIAIVDGTQYVMLDAAQDHKRLLDGDAGPNTGGMGAYTPVGLWTPTLQAAVRTRIIEPTIAGMVREGSRFTGFLYAGLMVVNGDPFVLEFNVRLGDPEAQALLFRLRSDLGKVLKQAADGTLQDTTLVWDERASACIVACADGYPAAVRTGEVIEGLDHGAGQPDVMIFHAGTAQQDAQIVTAGGRVLGVTALGPDVQAATNRAYDTLAHIRWSGMHYRKDIGGRELHRQRGPLEA